jgi:DNA repair photolyase
VTIPPRWNKDKIFLTDGTPVEAICPVIISASRATDIPAFFAEWFFDRLKAGYLVWVNPFNAKQIQYVSFRQARVIVFWSKNPRPLIPYLSDLDDRGINYYFQFTLNDYEQEGLEPNVPPISQRIETFKNLSKRLGKRRVIWRYDPLILTDKLTITSLVDRINEIARMLRGYTEKLVISFADIKKYKKVHNNLMREHVRYHDFNPSLMFDLAERLKKCNRNWGFTIATCSEDIDLDDYGIEHNRCIDDQLLLELFKEDSILKSFLQYQPGLFDDVQQGHLKDRGQRKECGCIVSKDIGMYNTCNHLCTYCYANTSRKVVEDNLRNYSPKSETLLGMDRDEIVQNSASQRVGPAKP